VGKLSFRVRLALLLAVLLGLMAVLGLAVLLQMHGVARALDSTYANRLVPMQQLRMISHVLLADVSVSLSRLGEGQWSVAQARAGIEAAEAQSDKLWADYKRTELVEEELHLISRAEPQLRYAKAVLQRLYALLDSGDVAVLRRFASQELSQALGPLDQTLSELIDVQLAETRRQAQNRQADFERARWLLVLLMLGCGGLASWLACWVWVRHQGEQQRAEAEERRLQQFYQARLQCHQLIAHDPASALQLYETLCRICVETGHAMLALVMAPDGGLMRRMVVHGPVEQVLGDVASEWPLDGPYHKVSITGQVLREGRAIVSNAAGLDPRMAHWHGTVLTHGVASVAAFPLRRDGRCVAALMLFAGEAGFFEPELVQLLDEMCCDVSFALDHLDRKQALQQALREAEVGRDRFRRLFDASSVSAVLTALPDRRILEINEVLCRRCGLSREQMLGRRMTDLPLGLSEADQARHDELLQRDGRVHNLEVTITSLDGRLQYGLLSGELLDDQGQPCLLSTIVDITELRAAQGRSPTAAPPETL
jgi:PAS domain S-box-containing protein